MFLEFRNFYSATITVEAAFAGEDSADATVPQWHTLVPAVTLMVDPHCETDAQAWHRLKLTRDGLPTRFVKLLVFVPFARQYVITSICAISALRACVRCCQAIDGSACDAQPTIPVVENA